MLKLLVFYGSLLIIYSAIIPSIYCGCIHDEVANPNVPIGELTYRQMRGKRDKHGEMFQPLNIHFYLDDIDPDMPERAIFNVNAALKKVIDFFQGAMTVRRSFNPFLLERSTCAQKWQSGINKHKCSRLKSGPEFCSVKLTDYIIPDRFLNKLEVFDYAGVNPRHILKSGQGVKDANFILFVISRTTSWCTENDVQAYGSFCRLDSNNRPVAGLLNLCPSHFSKKMYKASHYYNVIMHEVIHILGFSLHLYPKFKTCTSIYSCETPKKIVQEDSNGIQRLVFPELVKSMQAHFNCSEEEFGGPLEKYQGQGNASGEMKYASHWHPLLMYTSIMTPFVIENEYVVIDNITLALLASTGWYQVNFTKAEHFLLGKERGCKFGFEASCEESKHLCTPSETNRGCDILHYTIGRCESIVPYHSCGIFKPNSEENCLEGDEIMYRLDVYKMDYGRRCVMVTDKNATEPHCLVARCKSAEKVEFLVNSTLVECEADQKVETNSITLNCPEKGALCSGKKEYVDRTYCTWGSDEAIAIRMYFTDKTYRNLLESHNFKNFKVSIMEAIAESMRIPVNYIVNATLTVFKGAFLDFTICSPASMNNDELCTLLSKTQQFLESETFTHIFKEVTQFPVASTSIQIEPEIAVSFSDNEGFHMLSAIPVICGVFVVVTFIASVLRLCVIQKDSPKRETVEMEDISPILHENEKPKSTSSKIS